MRGLATRWSVGLLSIICWEKVIVSSDDGYKEGDIVVIPDIEIGTLHLKGVMVEVSSDCSLPIVVNSEVLSQLGEVEVDYYGRRMVRVRRGC